MLVGIYFCVSKLSESTLFALCYAIPSIYFVGVMVRLVLILTPISCVMSGIAVSSVLNRYSRYIKSNPQFRFQRLIGFSVLFVILILLKMFSSHSIYIASSAYSSPSIVLSTQNARGERAILDDFRESYRWLSHNTPLDSKVMSWWDYGYQITQMANRTTIVDNNTWNNTHIATVGRAFASTEEVAYKTLLRLDVDYVLVIFGGASGYSGDDINKFLWMVRIGGLNEREYFTSQGEYRIDSGGSPVLLNCLMYKLCYYRFDEIPARGGTGYDSVRRAFVGHKNIKLQHLEEAFTSPHWIVRIFRVKKPHNRLWTDE